MTATTSPHPPPQTKPRSQIPSPVPQPPGGRVLPLRTAARVAGIGYVMLFVLGIFANFVVREQLVVAGDAATTAANIAESEGLFRFGIAAFLVIALVDVAVALALHVLFRNGDHDVSLLAAWCRVLYSAMLGVAVVFLFQALGLLDGGLAAEALIAIETFDAAWSIGLLAFGSHLVLVGIVLLRTRFAPRPLGWLLLVAGSAFALDTLASALLADYESYEVWFQAVVGISDVIAEGWFALWLLFRAGRSVERRASA